MVKTIGNPLSWTADGLAGVSRYLASGTSEVGGAAAPVIEVERIEIADLVEALRKGVDDFTAFRSDVVFVVLIYPVIGLLLGWAAIDGALLPLLFPLISGFALLGPVATVGLAELSRRREAGLSAGWGDAFAVMTSPRIVPIALLGALLVVIFGLWLATANGIYAMTLGPEPPASVGVFLGDVFGTLAGWTMLVVGIAAGFVYAALVLAIGLVSFPLLLDRRVGVPTAVVTSVQVAARNPRTVAAWGLIVAAGLALGAATLFLGLIFVLPVLGHATWHLYRRAVSVR